MLVPAFAKLSPNCDGRRRDPNGSFTSTPAVSFAQIAAAHWRLGERIMSTGSTCARWAVRTVENSRRRYGAVAKREHPNVSLVCRRCVQPARVLKSLGRKAVRVRPRRPHHEINDLWKRQLRDLRPSSAIRQQSLTSTMRFSGSGRGKLASSVDGNCAARQDEDGPLRRAACPQAAQSSRGCR
jgi:hypothetical protein